MSNNKFIRSFTRIPNELFRLNTGTIIRLRAYPGPTRPKRRFDLLTMGGKVRPLALNPATYEWPNGASMRPNSPGLHYVIRTIREPSTCIYAIPAGVELPDDLILVHEFGDHYSLQAAKEMTVDELNIKMTGFLVTEGECLTKEAWLEQYPQATGRAR
ncbi:hypothetical protein Egran_01002 [Elaphomyces granulatus]|uniref:Tse2 ADP-ribosyltransferase toxin domain-containing protein n=1 Tax=Elaphomyces granulatus TaxID=519963 RepID=A0A232M581_9EURO|nr:hypothetical protein Egran_01002 [Elaphomyces granulatus]